MNWWVTGWLTGGMGGELAVLGHGLVDRWDDGQKA